MANIPKLDDEKAEGCLLRVQLGVCGTERRSEVIKYRSAATSLEK